MKGHTPTPFGLSTLEKIKQEHFPNMGKGDKHLSTGKDYRFSRRGQAEFRRAFEVQKMRLSGGEV
ncbi:MULTISPECIES: hypothetical protein [unclassified Vibrio]|uniref:hypothetical protein n=1 Tax=unclassified Vibrio TaxID=2614977 RepID=UPI0013617069|nr:MULTISPECIES: hypothetical protein [unclassified Vibrio]NAW57789.1 hypothetical protein [Vibrio sp. V36_P2S2PM302]NAX24629.1 hypothetical protein [Vibrio sp. V38_P2S17PM301]NAX29587.1 hypothetical protein [Vibrio sp. V37_P2S8PM304]